MGENCSIICLSILIIVGYLVFPGVGSSFGEDLKNHSQNDGISSLEEMILTPQTGSLYHAAFTPTKESAGEERPDHTTEY